MKKFLLVLLIIAVVFGGAGLFGWNYYNGIGENPLKSDSDKVIVTVERNATLNGIFDDLAKSGNLRSLVLTKLYMMQHPLNTNIKAGTYEVPTDATLDEFVKELREGKNINEITVTIPEGYTIERMGNVFEEKGLFSKQEFIDAAKAYKHPDWITNVESRRYAMEGFLMPDTYKFEKGITPEYALDVMHKAFVKKMGAILKELGINSPNTRWNRIVTIAAMIEREAANAGEMPTVSSVIKNRIVKRMRLQIDATVVYALGKESTDKVTLEDLKVDSPYNTYVVSELPVGPIANPGEAAIRAALQPADTNFIYYVLDPKADAHFFTANYNEFLAKKAEFGN